MVAAIARQGGILNEGRAASPWRFVRCPIRHPAVQCVIEYAEAAADAAPSVSNGIPGKTETRCKILVIGEVPASRCPRIAGNDEPEGRIRISFAIGGRE